MLPVGKQLFQVNDSNFYRYHRSCLENLGFVQVGSRRYRHYFAMSNGSVVVILGRDSPSQLQPTDYVSLVSIDAAGCILESRSSASALEKIAAADSMRQLQSIDAGDVVVALARHEQFVKSQVGDPRRLTEICYPAIAEHVHEVTARAKISHYNKKQIAFA